ncbi:MAG: hypothetical protein O2840_03630 [bacterium]|nr:hypothetical protein [bacterium]
MNNLKKTSLGLATASGVLLVTLSPASAFEGERRMGMQDKLVPTEMHKPFRAQHENLTEEEREQLREERRAHRDEKRAEMEAFVGLSRDEMRDARKSGQSMGDILAAQGKSEADAEAFLTEQANERVEMLSERHELSTEQVTTLRSRVTNFVQSMLARWFNK